MKRAIFKFTDGSFLNVAADCIDVRNGLALAWLGEDVVAVAQMSALIACYVTERRGAE